ncbi:MAG: PhnD/SsuA/transferrin family substrate-binding protein [Rhodobacteraceae bacterium]|jgi:ABC-type phosphate/phosphonate transport system substrate-binding protein|nr:PhnD/SsuA/transferrin family substrate-binding protein [Paracoccaceae bacterium]
MYDRPETRAATDRLWTLVREGLRSRGIAAPGALCRPGDGGLWALWEHPRLVLAQTCGLPYRARLHGRVTLVGTPDHGVEGCPPGHYRSVLVVRAGDARGTLAAFAGARLAVNDALSQSGWAAVAAAAAAAGVAFGGALVTGAHRASAAAVAGGLADVAAIDAVSWALTARWEPALAAGLRVLGRTVPTPGLPLIAAAGADAAAIGAAVADAVAALAAADRAALMLQGIVAIPAAAYTVLPLPPPLPPLLPLPSPQSGR